MDAIRILLVEDHRLVREGERQLLQQEPDIKVVGETADGAEAIRLAEELRPDVIVMDVRLIGLSGLEATRAIKAQHPDLPILILSAYEDDHYVFPLLDAGANGYLLKTASGGELAQAIRAVHRGETALDPLIAHKVVARVTRRQLYRAAGMAEGLTEREVEVLRAAAKGKTNKEIADQLFISPHTVQVHLRNIYGKLGVDGRMEAVAYAVNQGWIDLEDRGGSGT